MKCTERFYHVICTVAGLLKRCASTVVEFWGVVLILVPSVSVLIASVNCTDAAALSG
jgi:hypothetical protein